MSEILFERSASGIATITLNRPHPKNAVPVEMGTELLRRFKEVSQTASDRVLGISGAGDARCSGADLEAAAAAQSIHVASEDAKEGVVAFLEKRKPVFRGR